MVDGEDRYWVERRPEEGRSVLVRCDARGVVSDVLPPPFSTRTAVHTYGGRSVTVLDQMAVFSNQDDGRLYVIDDVEESCYPRPISPQQGSVDIRFGAPILLFGNHFCICVRERHFPGTTAEENDVATGADLQVLNDLVAIPTNGNAVGDPDAIAVLASGHDFYGAPVASLDGSHIAFIAWDHPAMCWDSSKLYELDIELGRSGEIAIRSSRSAYRDGGVSITQPMYDELHNLTFVSDESGWWNLYKRAPFSEIPLDHLHRPWAIDAALQAVPLAESAICIVEMDAEFGGPDWVLDGYANYAHLSNGSIVATWSAGGQSHLGVMKKGQTEFTKLTTEFSNITRLCATENGVLCLASSTTRSPQVVEIAVPSGNVSVLRQSRDDSVAAEFISIPTPYQYVTSGREIAHGFIYLPSNPHFIGPDTQLPPLIAMIHGGPTGSWTTALDYGVQFWTSRGFVVALSDHRGSTGYGRQYRQRLNGGWGALDVEDVEYLAASLEAEHIVNGFQACVRGASAGGYTTLCAAVRGNVFTAAASYYGIADPSNLAQVTHKFEAKYTDSLIGLWPDEASKYDERSPLQHVNQATTPTILFHGQADPVVPVSQAMDMAQALENCAVPVACLIFPTEQHGFRLVDTIIRTLEAELYFYGQIFGFEPADQVEPVEIRNRGSIRSSW